MLPKPGIDWDVEDTDFEYDANGNLIRITENLSGGQKTTFFQYDYRNLPVYVRTDDGQIVSDILYRYDAESVRIYKKIDNQPAEHYAVDNGQNLAIFTNENLEHWNIISNGVVGKQLADGSQRYYIKDKQGSIRAVVGDNGLVLENYDYYPMGLIMPGRSGTTMNTKELFIGKERDDETDLDYFGARYYDSKLGRWLTPDPLADAYPGVAPYAFVLNNFVNQVDTDGLSVKATRRADGTLVINADSFVPDGDPTLYVYDEDGNLIETYDLSDPANKHYLRALDRIGRELVWHRQLTGEIVKEALYRDFQPAGDFALAVSWGIVAVASGAVIVEVLAVAGLTAAEIQAVLQLLRNGAQSGYAALNEKALQLITMLQVKYPKVGPWLVAKIMETIYKKGTQMPDPTKEQLEIMAKKAVNKAGRFF